MISGTTESVYTYTVYDIQVSLNIDADETFVLEPRFGDDYKRRKGSISWH